MLLFLLIAGLLLALLAAVYLSQQRQDIRKRAYDSQTGVIELSLDKGTVTSFAKGQTYTLIAKMRNTGASAKSINAADVTVNFDQSVFSSASNSACGSILSSGVPVVSVSSINLLCYRNPGTGNYLFVQNAEVELGRFDLTVRSDTLEATGTASFPAAEIADVATGDDLALNGLAFSVPIAVSVSETPTPTVTPDISATPSATPIVSLTPTLTPTPSATPTATPTVTATPIFTPTPTPTCGVQPPKSQGNANGDCAVDDADYEIWKSEFLARSGTQADFDGKNGVDLVDYEIWRRGTNTPVPSATPNPPTDTPAPPPPTNTIAPTTWITRPPTPTS